MRITNRGFTPLKKVTNKADGGLKPLSTQTARERSSLAGFTLLEILITTVILTVGIAAILWAFSAGMFASTDIEDVELALSIAQSKLENIYGITGGVADESRHDVGQDGFSGSVYTAKNFQVETVTDNNNPEQVDVTVYWDTKGGEISITLITLVADY